MLVRTQGCNDKLLDLLTGLRAGLGYDLYVCADETATPFPPDAALPEGVVVLRHGEADAVRFGLAAPLPEAGLLWFFGDFAFYAAAAEMPDYAHYLLLDERVALVRGNPLFLEGLARRLSGEPAGAPFDLVAAWFGPRPPDWVWHQAAATRFAVVLGIFPPLVALSRRALGYLQDWRRAEATSGADRVFWEALLPSALAAGGFHCADLSALIPGAWADGSFPAPSPLLLGRLPPLPPAVELVYPVADERAWLAWTLQQARAGGTVPDLIGRLAPGGDLAVSEEVRAWFLRAALEVLAE